MPVLCPQTAHFIAAPVSLLGTWRNDLVGAHNSMHVFKCPKELTGAQTDMHKGQAERQPLLQHLKQPMPERQVAALTDKQNREQARPKLFSENHQGIIHSS